MLQELKRAAEGSVLETHPHYRTAIGALGVSLPLLMVFSSLVSGEDLQGSISAYYFTSARDVFVGILWVIGVFLFFYRYRPRRPEAARTQVASIRSGAADAWLGKMAGLSAVVVALFPTTPPPASPTQPPQIGVVHGIAAAVLFTCLAFFPLLLFSQSRDRGHVYRRYGWVMVALLLSVMAYAFAPDGFREAIARWKPILVLESLLIVVFGVSWFDRGLELAASEKAGGMKTDGAPLARAS
jgi:hypothetical protein